MKGGRLAAIFIMGLPLLTGAWAAVVSDSALQKSVIVAAHYAPWYDGNWVWTGSPDNRIYRPAYTPLLGFYSNWDPRILSQHIQWANAYGINTFMIEWCGIAEPPYIASFEGPVQSFLSNPDFYSIQFYFVYSIDNAMRKSGDPAWRTVNFSDPKHVAKLLSDFRYAARTYFCLPNYLRIRGKPVAYIWATGLARGNLKKAITKLRRAMKVELGTDLYLIADQVSWGSVPDLDKTPLFDAVMPYAMIRVQGSPPRDYALANSLAEITDQYLFWKNCCRDMGIDFIPGVIPGFNAKGAPWCYDENGVPFNPKVARNPKSFENYLKKAWPFVDQEVTMFYITSWSEWNEGTNIEPSKEFGFNYLKAVKRTVKGGAPPALPEKNKIRFDFQKTFIPGGSDSRTLCAAFDSVELLDAAQNSLLTVDLGTSAAKKFMGLGWSFEETGWPGADTFSWAASKLKYANLYLDLPPTASFMRIKLAMIDGQAMTITLDGVAQATLYADQPWDWATYTVPLSKNSL